MSSIRLSETEWRVFHECQDASFEGTATTPAVLAFRMPDVRPATLGRTRRRLAGLGLVTAEGRRVPCRWTPSLAAAEPTEAERAEVDDAVSAARTRHEKAAALAGLCSHVTGIPGNRSVPLAGEVCLDTILAVDEATPAAACRTILAAARRTGLIP